MAATRAHKIGMAGRGGKRGAELHLTLAGGMAMDSPARFLDAMAPIPRGDRERLEALVVRKSVPRGSVPPARRREAFLLGLREARAVPYFYTHKGGAESTKGFCPEGNIIVSYRALVEGRASHFSVQALEDSEIDLVDYAALQDRFQAAPRFKDASPAMVRKGFCTKEGRERQLLLFSAGERYRAYLRAVHASREAAWRRTGTPSWSREADRASGWNWREG